MTNGTPDRMQTLRDLAIGAVVMVVGAALLFALVGAVSDDGPDITAGEDPDPTATAPDAGTAQPTPDTTGQPTGASSDQPTGEATSGPTDDSSVDPSVGPTDGASTPSDGQVDPAGLTIQILDGVLDDGQATHDEVVACLRDDGYDTLIAGNRARTAYPETVIFYTAGNEAAAQQVAGDLGVGRVEEQPGNLSEDVPVHIVVGADATC